MKLGDICKFQSGGTPSKGETSYFNGNIPWITTVALIGSIIDESNAVDWITEKAIEKSAAKIVPANSVMVGTRVGVGKVAINKVPMSTSQDIISLLDIDESKWNKEFICKFILGKGNYLNSQARGATIKGIKIETLAGLQLPDIPLEQQCKIAAAIDAVNNLIALRKEQLAKLEQLVKSRFVELFGDVASCPKYGGVALGTICTTLSGGTPTTKVPEYYDGDIPWISTPYLGSNHINGSSAKAYITEDAIKNSATHLIPANTIMFGIRVGVGKSSIIDEPMCANQDIVALMGIDTNKYNLLFVKHVLDAYQSHFDSIKKGATILGITTEDLKKVLVPTVDIDLQNQFAAFVEQTDKSKLAIQQSLDKLELLKKSLMQEYFG